MKLESQILILISAWLLILALFIMSCGPTGVARKNYTIDQLYRIDFKNEPMKIHMKNGDLYVLNSWEIDATDSLFQGFGKMYSPKRKIIGINVDNNGLALGNQPSFDIPYSTIALLETNELKNRPGNLAGIAIPGTIGAILSIYCISNPKACFGSCPTFYAFDGKDDVLMAEGFSSSILPSLEKKDVDMLYWAKPTDSHIRIKLTNEALETHIIKYVNLLAVQRAENERVFADNSGTYYLVDKITPPTICNAPERNCTELLSDMDKKERYSLADSNNLLTKEYIELEFDVNPGENYGLLIGSRQSLMTTYLFYQGLAYLGNEAVHYAAMVESGDEKATNRMLRIWELLGGIEVMLEDKNGKWVNHGIIDEMGPIASDVHLIKLPGSQNSKLKIRLKMTKGLWRIDYTALASLKEKVSPVRLEPMLVKNDLIIDQIAFDLLNDSSKALITYPGDCYYLDYQLPGKSENFELFLETKGYYLEWMREEWIAEENMKKARLMFGFPRLFMRKAAPDFKALEPQMEEQFWNSRYVKK